jgi:hypothetical protein
LATPVVNRPDRGVIESDQKLCREWDVLRLPKTFYKDGAIATSRSKTGEPVYWPAPAPLRAILKNAPNHDAVTLCANSSGEPWTVCGFRASWRKIRLKLEAERRVSSGLTLYGLRHTVAVILRECGYDERTIADALGQKTIEMARHYARGADLTKKMSGVAKTLGREMNRRRTKVSNLSRKVSNLNQRGIALLIPLKNWPRCKPTSGCSVKIPADTVEHALRSLP